MYLRPEETPSSADSDATTPGLSIYRQHSILRHGELIEEMRRLAAPSYDADPGVLSSDLRRCDTAYMLRDQHGLVAFFLVSYFSLPIDATCVPTVFLGLSATRQETKGSAKIWSLYSAAIRDQAEFENQAGTRLLLFATLATPSSYNAMVQLWDAVEPRHDGTFSLITAALARAAADWLGVTQRDDNPFVLPRCYADTRYSAQERSRIARICEEKQFHLLADLGVDESRGDRLLVMCRLRGIS